MQLALLCNKPASWLNSRVRDALPDPLRQWLDRQDRQTRNEALQTLKRVDRESGWANAVEAMLSILESTGGADRAGVTLLAARLAEGVTGIEYDDDRPDPGEYDIASAGDAGVQGGGRRARRRRRALREGPQAVHLQGEHRRVRRLGHAPPGRRRPPPARHGTGQQGTREARQAPAPRPVPRRQGSRRLRLHERRASRRLHARAGSWDSVSSSARRTWCSTARPGAARRISRSGWA